MPQQTKTEALEELARLIRRDIMNGTARLNETWWFDDDTKMQDRIAHVLLDYSDEERVSPAATPTMSPVATSTLGALLQEFGPEKFVTTGPTIAGATLSWMHEQIEKAERNANKQIDELTEKCAALVVEREQAKASWNTVTSYLLEKATLRIDPDMSDPQPGKLLVVRLEKDDCTDMIAGDKRLVLYREQFVGFLVETPAVEEQGPWVVCFDVHCEHPFFATPREVPLNSPRLADAQKFDTKQEALDFKSDGFHDKWTVITLAEACAIVGGA